jgi:hypothetical protein
MKEPSIARNNNECNDLENKRETDCVFEQFGMKVSIALSFALILILFSTSADRYITVFGAGPVMAASPMSTTAISPPTGSVKMDITSPHKVSGIAGQYVRIEGVITNPSRDRTVNGGIAYISIVDLKDRIPIDLEDWSAQKGLYIPSVEAGQSLPLEWNIRLVKAGSYTIDMLFNKDGDFASPPSASSKVFLEVAPKLNLNPGNVLPVAFGVPAVIMGVLGVINYIRGRKTGIYQ